VIGVDRDAHKIASVLNKRAPFFEPGLQALVEETVTAGRLTAMESVPAALSEADMAMICVGTPSQPNGNLALDQLRRVSEEIGLALAQRSRKLIVVVRSTVFPGTCEEVVSAALGGSAMASVVSNPEFLREGSAVKDFLEPSLLVVGGDDAEAVAEVAALYAELGVEPCLVTLRTAEMIKYACNSFHAVKISFANEMGTLCRSLNIPGDEVMRTLCRDVKLNISPAYLMPAFAFGGSCLPKDLRALTYRASRLDLKLPLLEAALPANEQHLHRAIQAALALPAARIGVYGLAFKENTDDLRESPIVTLIEHLLGKGRKVRVFDPHIRMEKIYGSNRQFVLNAIPHIGKLMDRDLGHLLGWSEQLILAQRPAGEAAGRVRESGLPVLDLTRV
jgi:GDP-mannose 6-dehydrogenase